MVSVLQYALWVFALGEETTGVEYDAVNRFFVQYKRIITIGVRVSD